MKKKINKKKLKKGVLCAVLLMNLLVISVKFYQTVIYDKLDAEVKDSEVEYGKDVKIGNLLKLGNKNYKYSVLKDLNTSKVGKQKVVVKVEYKGVAKVVPLQVSVVDTVAPVVEIKDEVITIDEGDELNIISNINSVKDNEETLEFKDKGSVAEGDLGYYTVDNGGFDNNTPGEYTVNVSAVDKVGNKTDKSFKVNVNEVYKFVAPSYSSNIVSNAPLNAQGGDIVSIAYSFVGYPYVSGGASPSGFDCSGFVQYVYSLVGKSVSRCTYTQANDGVGVSYSEAQPGDILSWGHGGSVTHSAIYIGNGQMIHAMNSNTGVVISNVDSWTNADVLMAVRRVN